MTTDLHRRRFMVSTLTLAALGGVGLLAPVGRRSAFAAGTSLPLTAQRRTIEVNGKPASVFGLVQANGAPGLVLDPGQRFLVNLRNRCGADTVIHWHGQTPPNPQDGVVETGSALIPSDGAYDYDFVPRSGTHWMHSHHGLQEQQLMAAPMVVRTPADLHVVERLSLVVGRDKMAAIPVALLHGDLVAQCFDELVAGGGWKPAELDRRTVGTDRFDAKGLLVGIDAVKTVEIGQPLVIIIGVLHPLDRLADLVRGEFERPRAHDVFFVPVRILVEDRLLVDPVVRIGEGGQKRGGGELQTENHRGRVRRLDLIDHHEEALARAGYSLRWVDDLVPARHHVICGECRAVVPLDTVADLEGVGLSIIGRLWHLGAQVADEVGGR